MSEVISSFAHIQNEAGRLAFSNEMDTNILISLNVRDIYITEQIFPKIKGLIDNTF